MKVINSIIIAFFLVCMFLSYTKAETSKKEMADLVFIEAINSGDIKTVEDFIKSGIDVNAKYKIVNYYTYIYIPIISAVEAKNEKIVRMLLDAGADANTKMEGTHREDTELGLAAHSLGDEIILGTVLVSGVKSGNANIVKMLLDAGADVNVKVGGGYDGSEADPALIEAILSGNEEILKMLIEAGADLNIKGFDYSYSNFGPGAGYDERDAIEFAADYADEKITKIFIEASKDIKQKTEFINTGIYIAAASNNTKTVEMLISMGTGLNLRKMEMNAALVRAAGNGNEKIVKMLIDAGASNFGRALLEAAKRDKSENEEVIKMLIDAGADLNETKGGFSAYMQAVINGHNKTAKILADKGAGSEINVNAVTKDMLHDALVTAVMSNSELGVEKLLKAGVLPYTPNDNNILYSEVPYYKDKYDIISNKTVSPFESAVRMGNKKIIKMFLEAGADVNNKTEYTMRPLDAAIEEDKEEIFFMLVDAGGDLSSKSYGYLAYGDGQEYYFKEIRPLVLAVNSGNEKIVKMFLDAGADVDGERCSGDYYDFNGIQYAELPLEAAVMASNEKIFFMLVEAGANLNKKTYYGKTLLEIAVKAGNKNIEKFLKERNDIKKE